jgi:hypothetical protein
VGRWHSIPQATVAAIMGIGFWTFIANILLTLRRGAAPDAPPDRWIARFIGFSVVALLVGTVQGVIQILPPVQTWLVTAPGAGWMVTPYSHAQLNMVGFAIVGLAALTVFVLPRLIGRPLSSVRFAQITLTLLAFGIAATYLIYLTMGLLESIRLHELLAPYGGTLRAGMDGMFHGENMIPEIAQARDAVGGDAVHYGGQILAAVLLGLGYFAFLRLVGGTIGWGVVRTYLRDLVARIGEGLYNSSRPTASALPAHPHEAPRRALLAGILEVMGGWLGFMGMGWLTSGRGFIGMLVLLLWAAVYWSYLFIVLAVTAAGPQALLWALIPWIGLPLLSGYGAYRTYLSGARRQAASQQ